MNLSTIRHENGVAGLRGSGFVFMELLEEGKCDVVSSTEDDMMNSAQLLAGLQVDNERYWVVVR